MEFKTHLLKSACLKACLTRRRIQHLGVQACCCRHTCDIDCFGAPAVAEGDAYGNDSGGGNSTFYSLQAVISAGAAGFFGLAPFAVSVTSGGGSRVTFCPLLCWSLLRLPSM